MGSSLVVIALLLACHRTDPELDATARALAAWEDGHAKLGAGDPEGALAAFHAASEIRGSPLLSAWEAKASADAGDLAGAVALLDRAIAERPDFAEARYNRAAYLARLGRLEPAAEDLAAALASSDIRPLSVLEDPDFAPYLADPHFAFLPQQPLSVAVEPPSPTAFWGAEIALRLRVLGLVRPPVRFAAEHASGPLQLISVVQDSVATADGRALDLVWTWKVVGAGAVEIGPITVTSGPYQARVDAITVKTEAPPDKVVPPLEPLSLPTFDELAQALPEASVARVEGSVLARGSPADRVVTDPPVPPTTKLERRDLGETEEVLYRWAANPQLRSVRLTDAAGATRSELR